MALDKRRVQTAVTGDADSESPVVLPVEAIELDEFRQLHVGETYWCGIWLGGCVHQLTTKLYTDRVCHFAHIPDATTSSRCRRKFSGVSSADQLFIKHGLLNWMAEQEIAATAVIPRDENGARVGDEVLFDPRGRRSLRVLLSDDADLAPGHQDTSQTLLGPEVAHDPDVLTRQGYVHRIKCVPDGTRRRIQMGTQRHGGTDWFGLSECKLTTWGLSTPSVEEVRRLRATRHSIGTSKPKTPSPASTSKSAAVPEPIIDRNAAFASLEVAVRDGQGVTELRRCLDRAEAAARNGATAGENAAMQRANDILLRRLRGVGVPAPTPTVRKRAARKTLLPQVPQRTAVRPTAIVPPQDTMRRRSQVVSDEQRALDLVEEALVALRRRGDRYSEAGMRRLVRRLTRRAEQAAPWLTPGQRTEIAEWQNKAPHTGARPTAARSIPGTAPASVAPPSVEDEGRQG